MNPMQASVAAVSFTKRSLTVNFITFPGLTPAQIETQGWGFGEDEQTGEPVVGFAVALDTFATLHGRDVFCRHARRAIHALFGASAPADLIPEQLYSDVLARMGLLKGLPSDETPAALAANADLVATALNRISTL